MFRANPNIIGYLQKKNFFQNKSPSPQTRFQTSVTPRKNINITMNDTPSHIKLKKQISEKDIPVFSRSMMQANKNQSPINTPEASSKNFSPVNSNKVIKNENVQLRKSNIVQNLSKSNLKFSKAQQRPIQKEQSQYFSQKRNPAKNNRAFQSSRIQVKMCVQQLTSKIGLQLRQLQSTIKQLTVSLDTIFYKKLQQLKHQISQQIDSLFTQARNNIDNIMTKTNEDNLKKMIRSKHALNQAESKLKKFKLTMDTNWRTVAAEVIVDQYDTKIQQIIRGSQNSRKGFSLSPIISQNKQKSQQGWSLFKKGINLLIESRIF